MKKKLLIVGIAVVLIVVGLSGCVNLSTSSYTIRVTYQNNWDQYVDHTTEVRGSYRSGSLKPGITHDVNISGNGDSFNLILSIYNNSDIYDATDPDGFLIKSYALKIFYFNYTVTPEDNNFRFIVTINDYRNITAEKQ